MPERRLASRCATAHTVGRRRWCARREGPLPDAAPLQTSVAATGRRHRGACSQSQLPPSCQRRLASRCATAHTVGRRRWCARREGPLPDVAASQIACAHIPTVVPVKTGTSHPPPSCQRRLASRYATAHTVGRRRWCARREAPLPDAAPSQTRTLTSPPSFP